MADGMTWPRQIGTANLRGLLNQGGYRPVAIGDVPVMSALHCLLETASEARQRGDHGAADLLERDAARMLRAALQASTPEGGS